MSAHSPEPISMEFTRIRRRLDPDSVAWDATERVEERIAALAQENARLRKIVLDLVNNTEGSISDAHAQYVIQTLLPSARTALRRAGGET